MCWKLPSMLMLRRLAPAERPGGREVDGDAREGDRQDQAGAYVWRRDETASGLVDDEGREHEQRHAVGLRREDLDAPEPIGHRALRRPACESHGDERQPDGGRVGEHMGGVREQRQRVGEDPGDDLDAHEADDQPEREGQPAGVGVATDAVHVSEVSTVSGPRAAVDPVSHMRTG